MLYSFSPCRAEEPNAWLTPRLSINPVTDGSKQPGTRIPDSKATVWGDFQALQFMLILLSQEAALLSLVTDLEGDPSPRWAWVDPYLGALIKSGAPSLPRGCPCVVMGWNRKVRETRSIVSRDPWAPVTSPSWAIVGLGWRPEGLDCRQAVGRASQAAVNQAFGVLAVKRLHLKDFSLLSSYRN